QGKATVNGKAKMARDRPERRARGQRQQARLQCLDSGAAHSGDRHDFGVGQTGRSDEGPELLRYLFKTFGRDEIDLADRDDLTPPPKEAEDLQMGPLL